MQLPLCLTRLRLGQSNDLWCYFWWGCYFWKDAKLLQCFHLGSKISSTWMDYCSRFSCWNKSCLYQENRGFVGALRHAVSDFLLIYFFNNVFFWLVKKQNNILWRKLVAAAFSGILFLLRHVVVGTCWLAVDFESRFFVIEFIICDLFYSARADSSS